jgi:hypothetical protein
VAIPARREPITYHDQKYRRVTACGLADE